jgi:pimeloyl-ACP methyl ester carboxylesterase
VSLVLHELRPGSGDQLLLLHELGGSSARWDGFADAWPGAVFSLDFAGHGASSSRAGGAYAPELFAADADAVIAAIGPCRIAGAGLGAYVALLLAGGRPSEVSAALLIPGDGLDGGGPLPDFAHPARIPDEMLVTSGADVRPPDYAREFGLAARRLLLAEDGGPRPPWWESLRGLPTVVSVDPREALTRLRAAH